MEMEKKAKEQLRRYKKSRHTHTSSDSSSTDTDSGSSSYSSSDSERDHHGHTHPHQRAVERHHRKKKSSRRAGSSSGDERRKRDKRDRERDRDRDRDHVQKKLVAKRNHIKRKLKEARLKKRAAAALSSYAHRALSPATQAKLKKLAERKHLRAASKEQREREREKLRNVHRERERERERDHHRLGSSRSPTGTSNTTTTTKIRIHQDVVGKRQKSPGPISGSGLGPNGVPAARMHHQLMSREKIIIQTRARERTPSLEREREKERERERIERERERERERVEREHERQRHEHKLQRHDDLSLRERERDRRERDRERAEREAARDKERAEALARCQERQRERERLAREKIRRQEEEDGKKPYGAGSARDMDIAMPYGSRERSLETVDRAGRHVREKRELDPYEREQEFIEAERHGLLDEMRRYGGQRRRELSPLAEHYPPRLRDPRDIYSEEERERAYNRAYMDARYSREREAWLEARDYREMDRDNVLYADERERIMRERERERERERDRERLPSRGDYRAEWDREWDEDGVVGGGGGVSNAGGTPGRASGFVGGPKRPKPPAPQVAMQQHHSASEPDWDADERDESGDGNVVVVKSEPAWLEHDQRDKPRVWQQANNDWRDNDEPNFGRNNGANNDSQPPHLQPSSSPHHHVHVRGERGGGRGFRRGGGGAPHGHDHGERGYRSHPPPLMTLPVQPPGGYHGGGSSRGFQHKRMPYAGGGGGFLKKHSYMQVTAPPGAAAAAHTSVPTNQPPQQHAQPKPTNAAAQASAVVAATTAVAAAKAAAQSAANATTNPGILAQVSKLPNIKQEEASEDSAGTPELGAGSNNAESASEQTQSLEQTLRPVKVEPKSNGELSEISDSDDDILNKTDKVKPTKSELQLDGPLTGNQELSTDALSNGEETIKTEPQPQSQSQSQTQPVIKTEEVEEVLDFEEISDGELEEDAKHKGIGDALGVDWQGLIAETRQQATESAAQQGADRNTSAKQLWQPHRVLLDMGISFGMAGPHYAHRIIEETRQQLLEEQQQDKIKLEKETIERKSKTPMPHDYREMLDPEYAEPLACVQMGMRGAAAERQRLVGNLCGPGSRALSARQDLRLRRQLCGLPARECDLPRNVPMVSEGLRSLAMHMFQRTLDVK